MSLTENQINNRIAFEVFIPGFFDDYPLESSEFRLYAHIQRRAGVSGCFESIPKMAKHCYIALKTAKNAIKLLLAAGMIEIQERIGTTNIYTLTPPSSWVSPDQVQLLRSQIKTTKETPVKINPSQNCTGGGGNFAPSTGVNSAWGVGSNLTHKGIPIKVIPSKEFTLSAVHPTSECVCEKTDLDLQPNQEEEPISKSSSSQSNQEEPIPDSLALLSNQSETSFQTDIPSCRPTIAAGLFDKNEQANNKPSKPRFQSIDDLLNHILLDPSILASEPLPVVYKNEIKLRCWRFPWRTSCRDKIYQTCDRRLVELIAKERAEWDKVNWQQKVPTVIKSISNLEVSKAGLEELLVYWSKVLESSTPQTEQSKANDQPIGYYSNRSLDWHKATFCELLDLGDKVGQKKAIASFSTRYDRENVGATLKWLDWLKLTHPSMYAYLHPQAA
ncbi:helix-turn-helix domain-containing protein [Nostoc favosum]|uniref:Helix-turn-helix domain-containing protein n=1 Tax=Nostoc favosum CHAB5714 TaxID=2780399 RepID=A0ABS8IJF6_9NOSO|nr:helix-turn-helix domain-containing protein [Nostoc favosum]MCC5604314.1 helix-turn-helix domain-containing protein [Nostoc favosum CHAB5714]